MVILYGTLILNMIKNGGNVWFSQINIVPLQAITKY